MPKEHSDPIVAILAIGTEVAWGETVNTNASWLAQELLTLGVNPALTVTITDDPPSIQAALSWLEQQADWLVVTGGLGPTPDDLTVETLANYYHWTVQTDETILSALKARFASLNRSWVESNAKQAQIPDGATILPNPVGTAPGLAYAFSGDQIATRLKGLVLLPGVPREMKALWQQQAVPWLQARGMGADAPRWFQVNRWFFGLGESAIAAHLPAIVADFEGMETATYVGQGMVRVRLSRLGRDEDLIQAQLNQAMARLQTQLSPYDITDQPPGLLEVALSQKLMETGQTLSVAESCTGGLVSSRLTDVAGASAFVTGNVVSYANAVKTDLLGVPAETLAQYGAVSLETAAAMAHGICNRMGTDWGLSLTGIAGPGGGTPDKPVGTVCIGIANTHNLGQVWVKRYQSDPRLARRDLKELFANQGLYAVWLALQGTEALQREGFTILHIKAT